MSQRLPKNPLAFITGMIIILLFSFSSTAYADRSSSYNQEYKKILKPERVTYTREDSETCVNIIKSLQRNHYSSKKLTDPLSSDILDQYLNRLDLSKNLFTRNDIKEFELVRYQLDNSLKGGDLGPAYHIYNLFLERSFQRLVHINSLIETWTDSLDFTTEETIDLNREDLDWPDNKEELYILWEKELKNAVLTMKLDKEPDDEITKILKKRYTNRLNRLSQTGPDDAFRVFMNSVTTSFDPHTQYFPPRVSEDFDIQMSLSLEGIGAVLQTEYEYTKVVRLITAGPAEKSNLLTPGDKIIGVGQDRTGEIQDVVGWRIDEVVKLIRGPKDTIVRLQIIPSEKKGSHNSKLISIKRDKVKLEEQAAHKKVTTVKADDKTYTIGIIDIPTFYLDFKAYQADETDYRSTTRDVELLLKELGSMKIDGLIIDLRDNGGGSLQETNKLTGLFIKSGPTVQIKSRNGYISRMKDPDPGISYTGPLIVMLNRMSASASEIFAGAIKDYNRGLIVGTRSFGKGTVQSLQPLSTGQLKLTSAKFYRVSGESTQSLGVIPDIEYPNLYNSEETGESSLQGALPWDKSDKASYNSYKDLTPVVEIINKKHIKRSAENPGFTYLRNKYELAAEIYNLKSMSLSEKLRKEQLAHFNSRELEIENRLREVKGLEPVKNIDELHTMKKDKENLEDFLLQETEHVMADLIELSRARGYQW